MSEGKTMHNGPEDIPILTYIWVLVLSLWGGISSNIRKMRAGHSRFSISELIGDVVISGFIGLLTFFVCAYYETSPMLQAVFVGISSHMGTRAIVMMELAISEKLNLKYQKEEK